MSCRQLAECDFTIEDRWRVKKSWIRRFAADCFNFFSSLHFRFDFHQIYSLRKICVTRRATNWCSFVSQSVQKIFLSWRKKKMSVITAIADWIEESEKLSLAQAKRKEIVTLNEISVHTRNDNDDDNNKKNTETLRLAFLNRRPNCTIRRTTIDAMSLQVTSLYIFARHWVSTNVCIYKRFIQLHFLSHLDRQFNSRVFSRF